MRTLLNTLAVGAALLLPLSLRAAEPTNDAPPTDAQPLIDKGLQYLYSQQKSDGGWQTEKEPPAITAIVLKSFVQDPKFNSNTPFVKKGYEKLLGYQLDNGGIYQDMLANYNTSIAVSALAAANDPTFKGRLDKAVDYLKGLQWTEASPGGPNGEKVMDDSNAWYGGWGYGNHARPDGSNMQIALDALHDAGVQENDPAFQAAVKFVSRMQNRSESNDQKWAGDDGGFVYTPANNGESMAGEDQSPEGDRKLRSYGSMTYGGIKSMVYAGLTKEDPRVKAAMDWIRSNWTLKENPGMRLSGPDNARQGMYYYYHTFARALNVYDQPIITDAKGDKHDWRLELIAKLSALQQPDGSWTGEKRWMEANPVLATSYAVLALEEAEKDLNEHPAQR